MPDLASLPHPATLGLVLAGGLARRMGGGDKALITIGGVAILDRVLGLLHPACREIILNANGDPVRFARYGVAIADWPAKPVDPFFNVNTPEDAAEAERLAQLCR